MKNGDIIEYTRANGVTVETRAISDPFKLYDMWVIHILGERLPVPLNKVKESPRFIAAQRFYGRTV